MNTFLIDGFLIRIDAKRIGAFFENTNSGLTIRLGTGSKVRLDSTWVAPLAPAVRRRHYRPAIRPIRHCLPMSQR